jgi:hypothetical protein
MDNEETMLDEELDTDLEEDTADVEEDATDDEDSDDEFEYDEDGNIIIPEVVFDEEGEDADDESVEEGEPEATEESEDSEEAEEVAEPTETPKDDKDIRIAQLEAELLRFKMQGKETLSKLGVKNEDVMEGLMSLAAEADGVTTQEYIEKKTEEEKNAQGRALLQQQAFEKVARADLAELHSAYPETKQYTDIRNLPEDILKKFGRFRDAGLSAKEAYAAANPDGIRNNVATAVKKQSLHSSKSHLHTTVPKGSKDQSVVMPKSELSRWRDLFPEKSDKEIISLYKSTVN